MYCIEEQNVYNYMLSHQAFKEWLMPLIWVIMKIEVFDFLSQISNFTNHLLIVGQDHLQKVFTYA